MTLTDEARAEPVVLERTYELPFKDAVVFRFRPSACAISYAFTGRPPQLKTHTAARKWANAFEAARRDFTTDCVQIAGRPHLVLDDLGELGTLVERFEPRTVQ